ncbi:MAG TPA: glutamate--tRNA ligase [Candidatus Bilamarchaeaceae archaeon]|nr:glutamate--tRNA ligase [Candidatus Bilamarchaeaceae archaeon]
MDSPDSIIRKHAIRNAHEYGEANPGKVVGKVVNELPGAKKDMKALMGKIAAICKEVNALPRGELEKEFAKLPEKERKEEKSEIEIPDAVPGKVVVRFPPEPNGYPHIGHAKAFALSWTIARKYNGKAILRWDDTNPEAEKPEFVDAIRNGIKWLGLDWDDEKYCSDYMPEMYRLCEKLLWEGNAYACSCTQDEIGKGREMKERCACGSRTPQESLDEWKKMLNGATPEGGATVRLRGDMESLNTVMRDPTLFRIMEAPHYRQGLKYRAWPTYDFQGAVMDSLLGITHPIRSKEYELRDELYSFLLERLGMRVPKMISISRLSIRNAPLSKRLLRPLVEEGKVMGWDDPRLPTLEGLRRRGIVPDAIRKFVLSFGISKVESEPGWDKLLAENRKILDPIAPHYFFVPNPARVRIEGGKKKKLREMECRGEVWISGQDASGLEEGETIRLKDLYNVKVGKTGDTIEASYAGDEVGSGKKLQWVSEKLECEVLRPGNLVLDSGEFNPSSLTIDAGYCEKSIHSLKEGDMVQFERYGFCRLDSRKPLRFVYSC